MALIHLGACAVVGVLSLLVIRVWYPFPYDALLSIYGLYRICLVVDIVCGPLLTLILYNPTKSAWKWRLDLLVIVAIQGSALLYGLHTVVNARPVFLSLEGDRFRVVQAGDVVAAGDKAGSHSGSVRALSYWGPTMIAARLATPADKDYLQSIQLSVQGVPPSFREERWEPYTSHLKKLFSQLHSIDALRQKNPKQRQDIDQVLSKIKLPESHLGYLPLVKDNITDWVVIVSRIDGMPVGYLHADGWL